jgi:DNA invertase Pin-like site-specific DNA recombinase
MAVIAQEERELIAARTKAALAAASARGVALGGRRATLRNGSVNTHVVDNRLGTAALQRRAETFAATVGPTVAEMRQAGHSLRQIAATLADRGVRTARGGAWSADAVRRVLVRASEGATLDSPTVP